MFKSVIQNSNVINNNIFKRSNYDSNDKSKTFLIPDDKKYLSLSKHNSKTNLIPRKSDNNFFSENTEQKKLNIQKLKDMIFSPGDRPYNEKGNENKYHNNIGINNYKSEKISNNNTIDENGGDILLLPKKNDNKKTLVLDLDETLIHSAFEPFKMKNDITLNLKIQNDNYKIYILKRPYLDQFLNIVTDKYEVIIFTASIPDYANPLLDRLDPYKKIKYRLFRQHCTKSDNGLFLKNLNKLGRNLKDIIIIDNNPISYSLHKMNGLPILTWHSIQSDNELIKIIPLLTYLTSVDDVRTIINKVVNGYYINYKEVNRIISNKNSISNDDEDDYFKNWFQPKKTDDKNMNIVLKNKNNIDGYNFEKEEKNKKSESIIKYKGLLGTEIKFNFDDYKKAHNAKITSELSSHQRNNLHIQNNNNKDNKINQKRGK